MDANSFCTRVRRARMASGLQGKELAMRLGISRPYLSQIEKGSRIPANELLIRLASELKVTPHWLTHGDQPESVAIELPAPCPNCATPQKRASDLEAQLTAANETIHNLSVALALGRSGAAPPASGACGGEEHKASERRERRAGA